MSGDTERELPFQVTAETQLSQREQYRQLYIEYVRAPLLIIWEDYRARFGGLILLLFALMSTVGPMLVTLPAPDVSVGLVGPFQTMAYPLGTNSLGQGLLALMIHASVPMMKMVIAGALFATSIGASVGLVAGFKGGWVDSVLSMFADIAITVPGLPLTILLMLVLQTTNPLAVGLVISVNMWGGLARSVRSEILKLRHESYVEASTAMGLSTGYIVSRDLLPNVMPFVFMRMMRTARGVIFASVGLYFLGVLPYSRPNWGVVLQNAWANNAIFRPDLYHLLLVPMLTIVLFTYGLTLLAQSTDKIFNPKIRARHMKED